VLTIPCSIYVVVILLLPLLVSVSLARPVVEKVTKLRLSMDDFDTLEIIGRGAFGEVKVRINWY